MFYIVPDLIKQWMKKLMWLYIVVWFQVHKGNSHPKDLTYKLKRIFGELHCLLTCIYIIFLSLLTYISAYFIDFVNFTSNFTYFYVSLNIIVLSKTEKTLVQRRKSWTEEICSPGIFNSNELLENYTPYREQLNTS